jgi:hypothetical protein
MDFSALIGPIVAIVIPIAVGFAAGRWSAIKQAAAASANPYDDMAVAAIERLAERIVKAKQESPNTPLGEG